MKNFFVSIGREGIRTRFVRGASQMLYHLGHRDFLIRCLSYPYLPILEPFVRIKIYMRSTNILRIPSFPPPPPKKEPRVDLQERAILPSIRGLHMYYSIALFTERPKAKRPTSTEHLIHFNVPSKHIYHIHTRARVNQPPPLLLLLAVLIDRTEVVIIVKPI